MNTEVPVADRFCAICLQNCHHPTKLPCGHIFCFLCVKGVAIQSKKCAMCRAAIPADYLNNPVLLDKVDIKSTVPESDNVYQWYYEGRNGWWKYDERSNIELETAFNLGQSECMLLLAGAVYCIEFEHMVQIRRTDPTRRRRIRRDKPNLQAKGIAGIKISDNRLAEQQVKTERENVSTTTSRRNDGDVILIPDEPEDDVIFVSTNATVVSQSDHTSDIIQRLSSIDLTDATHSNMRSEAEDT